MNAADWTGPITKTVGTGTVPQYRGVPVNALDDNSTPWLRVVSDAAQALTRTQQTVTLKGIYDHLSAPENMGEAMSRVPASDYYEALSHLNTIVAAHENPHSAALSEQQQVAIGVKRRRADMVARVNKIQASLEHDTPIRLANSFDEMPIEVQMDALEKAIPITAVKGCYVGGEVYINLAAITTPEELEQTINEELYQHFGFHTMYGLENRANMGELYRAIGGDEGFERLCREHNVDLSGYQRALGALDQKDRESILAEELLAHLGATESPKVHNRVQVLYGGLRQWWRENGFTRLPRYNNADIANLLHKANKAARQGPVQKAETADQIIRRMADAKVVDIDTDLATSSAVATAWSLIASDDRHFKLGRSEHKEFEDIAAELLNLPERLELGDITPIEIAPEEQSEAQFSPQKQWHVELHTRRGEVPITVSQRNNAVWIDVLKLEEGELGQTVYNAVAAYAHNNGLKFIGDPTGLSDIAVHRRLENMISSALKFGTTAHLAPHPRQLEGSEAVPGLDWREGEHEHNLNEMIKASYLATLAQVPHISDMVYNPERDQFINEETGYVYTGQDFYDIATAARRDYGRSIAQSPESSGESELGRRITVGRTTLERAVLTQTVLRAKGEERSELLAQLGHGRTQRLNGILYSLSADPEDWGQPSPPPQIPREWAFPLQQSVNPLLGGTADTTATSQLTPENTTAFTPVGRAQRVLLDRAESLSKQSNELGQDRRRRMRSAEFNDRAGFLAPLGGRFIRPNVNAIQSQVATLRNAARAYRLAAHTLTEHAFDEWRPLIEKDDQAGIEAWFERALGVELPHGAQAVTTVRQALEAAEAPAPVAANELDASTPAAVDPSESPAPQYETLEEEVLGHIQAVNEAYEADDLDRAEELDVKLEELLERIETGLQEYEETLELDESDNDSNFDHAQLDELLATLYLHQYVDPSQNTRYTPQFDDEAQFVDALRDTIDQYGSAGVHEPFSDEQVIDMARDAYESKAQRLDFLRDRLYQSALRSEQATLRVPDPKQPRPRPPMWVDETLSEEGALFQFAGRRAVTANQVALAAAMQFTNEGHDSEAVRQKTGWFKGQDDKWRFEISDDQARLKTDQLRLVSRDSHGFAGRLADILDHPELFAAYPDLANALVDVRVDPNELPAGASFDPGTTRNYDQLGDFEAQGRTAEEATTTLLHEIQHAIQYREQFSRGSNAKWMHHAYFQALEERSAALNKRLIHVEQMSEASDRYEKEAQLIRRELGHIDTAFTQRDDPAVKDFVKALYFDVYGEREARLTEQRLNMTEQQRLETAPEMPARFRSKLVIQPDDGHQELAAKMAMSPVASVTLLPGQSLLRLTQAADRSSFLHEGAHLFLDMEIKTSRDRTPDRLQRQICEYLEVDNLQQVERAEHEKFARGFELYMREVENGRNTPQGMHGVFNTVKGWLRNTYAAAEDLGEPLSPAAKEMYAELLAGYEQADPNNLYQAERHERLIAMQLHKTGLYRPGEAYTNAKLVTAYALAKAERDPEYPTVDRVFDRMNLRIERATDEQMASDVHFDWDSFDLRAMTRRAMATDPGASRPHDPDLNNYDLSREARQHSAQYQQQPTEHSPAMVR
ncbi:LPD23 domain-containing protein [Marinimicrobium sp. ABcell2]|uniref:LPD23 domain-containing protein n=1 Tax=Marinimicrobium sp. ABcell2 TaxID=3069751 RepID=UPI0027B0FF2F|nr:LPD23 domain-containing protein [Marinimicrobium sp. ABcell2]MDQ2077541.1 LPD23 domain-containing protein [Marinimicrobium sp. ABcell2]